MSVFIYQGPAKDQYGNLLQANWSAETTAPTPQKALSNLRFQYKKQYGHWAVLNINKLSVKEVTK